MNDIVNCHNCHNCHKCDKNDPIKMRSYKWYCEPRAKDKAKGYKTEWTTFEIHLCDSCYLLTSNCDFVRGWDWWDACDDLDYNCLKKIDNCNILNTPKHLNI